MFKVARTHSGDYEASRGGARDPPSFGDAWQFAKLHFADIQMQRFASHAQEAVRGIGQCHLEVAGIRSGALRFSRSKRSRTAVAQFWAESTNVIESPRSRPMALRKSG